MKDLKTYRDLKGLTQQQLADRAGVHSQTVFKLENGRSEPTDQVKKAVETALGVRINWLATLGIEGGELKSWEQCESDLRHVLLDVKRLKAEEFKAFLTVCHDYTDTLEAIIELNTADDPDAPLMPPDVYFALMQRARGT